MHSKARFHNAMFGASVNLHNAAITILLALLFLIFMFALIAITAQPAQGQTYNVIHDFNLSDGNRPFGSLTMDGEGNIYGTTWLGPGFFSDGSVFRLAQHNGNWQLSYLHSFHVGDDGSESWSGVTVGPDGTLYGTTSAAATGDGTVFSLRAATNAASVAQSWQETTLYVFALPGANGEPNFGNVLLDGSGDIYGVTLNGGEYGSGTVYKLARFGDEWTANILYAFGAPGDGCYPWAGLISDGAGNFYGTTDLCGPNGNGTVYELSPSESDWTEQILYSFPGNDDGYALIGGVIFDRSGNLYGTTLAGGINGGGTVFELTPSNGGWAFSVLYSFTGNGLGPRGGLTMDAFGDLYGTTSGQGAYGLGMVFKLTPSAEGWIFSDIHDFNGSDGQGPWGGSLLLAPSGKLYGTTNAGGTYGYGVVFEITP